MATQREEFAPVQVDEDGYLRVRVVTTELDVPDVIRTFLAAQDPALLGDAAIRSYPELDPVSATLRALLDEAEKLGAD